MKTLIILLVSVLSISAQTNAVKFWGVGNAPGYPQFWPADVHPGVTVAPSGYVLLSDATLGNIVATNSAAYNLVVSNTQFAASSNIDRNTAAFLLMNSQIPLGITDSSNRIVSMTGALASWNSGTNNAAGTNAIIKTTLQNVGVSYQYLNQMLVYLSRLGPGLPGIYQAANDPVGH